MPSLAYRAAASSSHFSAWAINFDRNLYIDRLKIKHYQHMTKDAQSLFIKDYSNQTNRKEQKN